MTGFSVIYQAGEKMLTGIHFITLKNINFFSTYANTGILFQTGAWEKKWEKNMGIFWILGRVHIVRTSNTFESVSGYPPDRRFFKGYSIGFGIEINNVLNIKSFFYKYIKPAASNFDIPIYQITFNYSLKNN